VDPTTDALTSADGKRNRDTGVPGAGLRKSVTTIAEKDAAGKARKKKRLAGEVLPEVALRNVNAQGGTVVGGYFTVELHEKNYQDLRKGEQALKKVLEVAEALQKG